MKRFVKGFLSMMLTAALFCSMCPAGAALEGGEEDAGSGNNSVVFTNVSQIAIGEYTQRVVRDADGREITVKLERVPQYGRAGGETWLVQYKKLGTTVEFYMTVSNNKVTSVYDYYIYLFGASYDDASLTKTSTYGKLTFTGKGFGGLTAATCWLKGTVTGADDQIEVTWQM